MSPAGAASLLPEVAVTATRVSENVTDIPATITVIDSQQIDRGLVQSIQNLIRYEPGVTVNTDPNRFGASSFNIRGLEGNRVVIQVDGVRAPSLFTFGIGPFNTSTRNMVDLDAMKSVEILRGPASTLYGSDALGGVVSYITKDPLDYLNLAVSPFYAGVKSFYASANEGWQNTATLAAGNKEVQGLLVYTYYTGHETENFGTNESTGPARTAPNPQNIDESNWLAKLAFTPDPNQTLKFTYERYSHNGNTDILSLNASTPTTSALFGQDDNTRDRGTIAYEWHNPAGGWFAGFSASVYQQTSTTNSDSQETRSSTSATCSGVAPGVNTCYIPREFDFRQKVTGGTAQLESLIDAGGVAQRILWGAEIYETQTSALRNALRYNLTTGTVSNVIAGDTFPVRDFPNTTSMQIGAYAQDQISLLERPPGHHAGAALRLLSPDHSSGFHLQQQHAARRGAVRLFRQRMVAEDRGDVSRSTRPSTSMPITRLASVRRRSTTSMPRSAIRSSRTCSIPNPDLKSETSQGLEMGLKGDGARGRIAVAVFYNRYHDFIDSRAGLDCPADPMCMPGFAFTFQSVNRASVRIYGAEAKGEWVIDPNWTLAGSIAYANGQDTTLDVPLNSVNPLTGVTGIRYLSTADQYGQYGGALNVTMVQRKTSAASVGGVTPFLTPGFATVDLTGFWNINKNARITAGVFNIFDRKYWLWGDVNTAALGTTSAGLDRYTQPGINASVALQLIY